MHPNAEISLETKLKHRIETVKELPKSGATLRLAPLQEKTGSRFHTLYDAGGVANEPAPTNDNFHTSDIIEQD